MTGHDEMLRGPLREGFPGNSECMRKLDTPPPVDLAMEQSILPAIDALVARYSGRDTVAAVEVIDLLLDLRLLVEAEQLLFSNR